MKKTIIALLALGILSMSAGAWAKPWQEIRFGVEAGYAPYEYKTPDGKLAGFDIDLGNEICKRLNAKCVWVENDFDGLIPALQARKFDGILSCMGITAKRKEQITFSDKLYNTPTRLVARAGSALLPTAASLKGKRIGVQAGTIQESYAKKYWAPFGVQVISYQQQSQVLSDLQSGRLDAALQDAVLAQNVFLKQPAGKGFAFAGANLSDPAILGVGTGVGLRKNDPALKTDIDKAIAGMLKDGTYKKIADKYFTFNVYN